MAEKPFSQACENNKDAIFTVLREHLDRRATLLEIGSGTGQHAAWLSGFFPDIEWQPSDLPDALPGIRAWLAEQGARNVRDPLVLDVRGRWPEQRLDYIFTANTFHIMDTDSIRRCVEQAALCLTAGGLLLIYGPFRYQGQCSESNERFDAMLRERDPRSGVRKFEWVHDLMAAQGLELLADHPMPANNRTLVFRRR